MNHVPATDIDNLNTLLQRERSAVETYTQCIDKMDSEPLIRSRLQELRASHEQRVQKLSQRISMLGGTPDDSSGVWGSLAKAVQGGAKMFGKSAAISTLEQGEDRGNKAYDKCVEDLSPATREFVRTELLPEQRRTHDALSAMQHAV